MNTTEMIYECTVLEQRMDKIRQTLLFYDNLPEDEEIVRLVKRWNELYHRHSKLEYLLKLDRESAENPNK